MMGLPEVSRSGRPWPPPVLKGEGGAVTRSQEERRPQDRRVLPGVLTSGGKTSPLTTQDDRGQAREGRHQYYPIPSGSLWAEPTGTQLSGEPSDAETSILGPEQG